MNEVVLGAFFVSDIHSMPVSLHVHSFFSENFKYSNEKVEASELSKPHRKKVLTKKVLNLN